MRCVQITESGAVVDVVPQPADYTGCALVLVAGDQAAPFSIPPGPLLAEAFGWSMGLVLTCGLAGFVIGRLVNFWR